jgi:hypothetical protein
MKKIIAPAISIALAAGFMVACASTPISTDPALKLKTGGGLTGPFFELSLSQTGSLSVQKESLPFADTKSGLTTDTVQVQLSPQEIADLFVLASAVDDFALGCNIVGHGTSARMWVTQHGQTSEFSCKNASDWPMGRRTQALITAINSHLPEGLHVF